MITKAAINGMVFEAMGAHRVAQESPSLTDATLACRERDAMVRAIAYAIGGTYQVGPWSRTCVAIRTLITDATPRDGGDVWAGACWARIPSVVASILALDAVNDRPVIAVAHKR